MCEHLHKNLPTGRSSGFQSGRIGWKSILILTSANVTIALALRTASAQSFLGKNSADWEYALKSGSDPSSRRNAAFALGKLGSAAAPAMGTLKKHLREDNDPKVREAVAFALGEIGRQSLGSVDDPNVIDVLAKALKDDNLLVRRSAACALGNFGASARPAQEALSAALGDDSPLVRQNVAWALGRVSPKSVPSLKKALEDKDLLVRRDAAGSLGQLDPADAKSALPELLACCAEKNSALRLAALGVLIKLVEPDDKKAAAAIRPALEDEDREVRQNAALALANIGGPEAAPAVPILVDALEEGELDLQRQAAAALAAIGPEAAPAVPKLIGFLNAADAELRRNVVLALGGIGPKASSAIPAVVKVITNPKEEKRVRMEAAVTMNRFGVSPASRKTVPELLKVLENPNDNPDVRWRITWALRVYKDELADIPGVVPAFIKVLNEPLRDNKMVRYDCAYLLGMLKGDEAPKEALDVLLEFLKDPNMILYDKTAVKTSASGSETDRGNASVVEQGKGDARIMAVAALTEVGSRVLAQRPDIVRELHAIAENPEGFQDLREKTKALLRKIKR
jgi:HEAT repeat protein